MQPLIHTYNLCNKHCTRQKYKKVIEQIYQKTLESKMKCPNELRCWHGAAILFQNKIISLGINHCKGCSKMSTHAEKDAIMKCSRDKLRKSILIVIRISRDVTKQKTLISKPCHKCSELIKSVGIPKIFYSV